MFVLALDPSLSSTGYAVIESESKTLLYRGKITSSDKLSTDDRIQLILNQLHEITRVVPGITVIALEDGYVGANYQSSLKLAQLRGALIAYFKYNGKIVTHQMPKEIRKNFGLSGSAKKDEVAAEVLKYYPYLIQDIGPYSDKQNKQKTSDIYDAISIGLSYIINLKE